MRFLTYMIATGFGAGFSPVAPGTAGSLLAAAVIYLISPLPAQWLIAALFVLFWIGVHAAAALEKELGKDPSQVVVDEIVGMGISLILAPKSGKIFLAAFLLFRLFDVWKPFPIRQAEKIPGGAGIMLDDVIAGVYALLVLHLLLWIF
jgi:phosphatidylglycerophosphatase A